RRTNKDQPCPLDALGEIRVFRQESVAGMDRFRTADLRGEQDRRLVQVAVRGGGRPDAHRLVGVTDMRRFAVGLGVNDDGAQPKSSAGALDTQGDLSAVGYEDRSEHAVRPAASTL